MKDSKGIEIKKGDVLFYKEGDENYANSIVYVREEDNNIFIRSLFYTEDDGKTLLDYGTGNDDSTELKYYTSNWFPGQEYPLNPVSNYLTIIGDIDNTDLFDEDYINKHYAVK